MMRRRSHKYFISMMIVGCKPDNLEIEVYTSDIESASDGEVVEVPLKATFKLMGEDKDNQLPKAKKLALKYMPSDSEIKISKGDYVIFPKGLKCRWKVMKPVRKHYNFG